MEREIFNMKQACMYLGCSRSTLYKYMERPDFPAFQEAPGCKHYFVKEVLKKWFVQSFRKYPKGEQAENIKLHIV